MRSSLLASVVLTAMAGGSLATPPPPAPVQVAPPGQVVIPAPASGQVPVAPAAAGQNPPQTTPCDETKPPGPTPPPVPSPQPPTSLNHPVGIPAPPPGQCVCPPVQPPTPPPPASTVTVTVTVSAPQPGQGQGYGNYPGASASPMPGQNSALVAPGAPIPAGAYGAANGVSTTISSYPTVAPTFLSTSTPTTNGTVSNTATSTSSAPTSTNTNNADDWFKEMNPLKPGYDIVDANDRQYVIKCGTKPWKTPDATFNTDVCHYFNAHLFKPFNCGDVDPRDVFGGKRRAEAWECRSHKGANVEAYHSKDAGNRFHTHVTGYSVMQLCQVTAQHCTAQGNLIDNAYGYLLKNAKKDHSQITGKLLSEDTAAGIKTFVWLG